MKIYLLDSALDGLKYFSGFYDLVLTDTLNRPHSYIYGKVTFNHLPTDLDDI